VMQRAPTTSFLFGLTMFLLPQLFYFTGVNACCGDVYQPAHEERETPCCLSSSCFQRRASSKRGFAKHVYHSSPTPRNCSLGRNSTPGRSASSPILGPHYLYLFISPFRMSISEFSDCQLAIPIIWVCY
jgi:hypothetical protein